MKNLIFEKLTRCIQVGLSYIFSFCSKMDMTVEKFFVRLLEMNQLYGLIGFLVMLALEH